MIYCKSQTETAEKKNELQKIAITHVLMQFCKNEEYLNFPWLLDCSFTTCQDHGFWWLCWTWLGSQFHTQG